MKDDRAQKGQRNNDGLLSTYFASLISLLLCLVMLFGTTFAWFHTDNTSVGNEIHSGILNVDIVHGGVSLAERPEHSVFSSGELWSPDRNWQTESVQIRNTGNVVLDYKLDFVPVSDDGAGVTAAGLFTVFVDGEPLGTLDQFLRDGADGADDIRLAAGQGLEPGAAHTVQIKLQMDQTGAYGFMGQSVPIYLKLEAYQHLSGAIG